MKLDKIDTLSFEASYDLLEQVIQKLEEGDLSLDDSVALYEEGMLLAAHCGRQLDDAEVKISELLVAAADDLEDEYGEGAAG
jgi:exodeoxyribonuclease VII small subunit